MESNPSATNEITDMDEADRQHDTRDTLTREGDTTQQPPAPIPHPPSPPPPPPYPHSNSSPDVSGLRTLPLTAHSVGMATPTNSTLVLDTETIPASPLIMPLPLREEPTLKEKLVERERQRRVETERARLKRQFALMSNGGGLAYENTAASISSQAAVRENGSVAGTVGEESTVAHTELDDILQDEQRINQQLGYTMERFLLERDAGAGTTNGATSALPSSADPDNAEINVVAAAITVADPPTSSLHAALPTNPTTVIEETEESAESTATDKGVVMERFLSEPVHVEPAANVPEEQVDTSSMNAAHVHRSVSFDMELHQQQAQGPATSLETHSESSRNGHNHHSPQADHEPPLILTTTHAAMPPRSDDGLNVSLDSNSSVKVEVADDIPHASSLRSMDHPSAASNPPGSSLASIDRQSTSSVATPASLDQTRVLRLTEAEIQEMASIEEASIGNAPPSERDAESLADSSLVGELVGDFTGPNMITDQGIAFSQGTNTTAVESVSVVSAGNQSGALSADGVIIDQQSLDDVVITSSVSSHLIVSPVASIVGSAVSVTANPPSVTANPPSVTGNPPSEIVEATPVLEDDIISPVAALLPNVDDNDNDNEDRSHEDDRKPPAVVNDHGATNDLPLDNNDDTDLRPGPEHIVNRRIRPGMVNFADQEHDDRVDPEMIVSPLSRKRSTSLPDKMDELVDDFDYDKDNEPPASPRSLLSDSFRDLPCDGNWQSEGKMTLSPLHPQATITDCHIPFNETNPNETHLTAADAHNETGGLPPLPLDTRARVQAVADHDALPMQTHANLSNKNEHEDSYKNMSNERGTNVQLSYADSLFGYIRASNDTAAILLESEDYVSKNYVIRAGQERLFSLLATCLIELAVLSILLGGSERLCTLLGRRRYHLLVGFIPLVCAISGNLSLQASTLTARAILDRHVTADSYMTWFRVELATSTVLGLKLGSVIGFFAFFSGEKDFRFAFTIFVAQFMSCVSAGCIGVSSPLVLAGIFKRDVGKWIGLVTSFQDVVGCLTVVLVCYCFLVLFGSTDDVNAHDSCGLTESILKDACAAN